MRWFPSWCGIFKSCARGRTVLDMNVPWSGGWSCHLLFKEAVFRTHTSSDSSSESDVSTYSDCGCRSCSLVHIDWQLRAMASYEARNSGFPSYSPSPHLLSSSFTQSNKACVFVSETTLMVQSNWQGKLPIMGFLPWQFHDSLASTTDWSSRACFKILWRPSANVYWPTEHLIHGLRSICLLFLSTYQWDCWFTVPTRVLRRGVGFWIEIGVTCQ